MEKLKQLRLENGYSLKKMSSLVGISKSYYYQLELNNRNLSYNLALRIASVFNMKPDDIFYEDTKKRM